MKNEKLRDGVPFPLSGQSENQNPICPHCEKPVERIDWRIYGEGKVGLVACSNCKKVIGANVAPNL